jgi:hypothetical protein
VKHADCGGELTKRYCKAGEYRCELCRQKVKVGRFGGFRAGYIQKQVQKMRTK